MNLTDQIKQACSQIAPIWPLSNFVAVNPYLGFTGRAFPKTAHYLMQVQGSAMVMPHDWYAQKYADGAIDREDIGVAIKRASAVIYNAFEEAGQAMSHDSLLAALENTHTDAESQYSPGLFSFYIDKREGTHWQNCIREEAAKWCAAYYDRGQAVWSLPNRSESFYHDWREVVGCDFNLACSGLPGAHRALASMPITHDEAIADALAAMEIPERHTVEWLYRVMLMLPGWAGYLRYLDREQELRGGEGTELHELLAVLLNYERVVHAHYTSDEDCLLGWKRILMEDPVDPDCESIPLDLAQRLLWQSAYEHHIERGFKQAIHPTGDGITGIKRPQIQAAFCIDVRSEAFRRNLESALPEVQTIGFAGFFGLPLKHIPVGQKSEESRCPALLAPPVASHECNHGHPKRTQDSPESLRSWKGFREGAASCFSFVETLGMGYIWKLFRSTTGLIGDKAGNDVGVELSKPLDLDTKVTLATGILEGLGLTVQCAPLVLLCGHGSTTQNNPYASSLDCGACGGHPGDVNARIAAALLNEPKVRSGLAEKGILVSKDTLFIAGLHNTTTDEVTLYDADLNTASHQKYLSSLRQGLDEAGLRTVLLRAQSLNGTEGKSAKAVKARSRDWSQVRPEWGLAGNAGFIVAPRSWTRSGSLNGRTFLHEYNPADDPDGVLLETIMGGPMIVGSWINLQYYASATDNAHYGSGHKAIHNIVGGLGVALGNASDLSPGLPLQSIHDGLRFVHEPSRLHVMVAAEPDRIDGILSHRPEIAELVENQWLHLTALGADGEIFNRRLPGGQWEHPAEADFPGALPG